MKIHVTQRTIRNSYSNIISVGYCKLQHLLSRRSPEFYTSGSYGWNADIYVVSPDTVIVTGYRPFGNCKPNYEQREKYESKAADVIQYYSFDPDRARIRLDEMIQEFVKEALENENG